jgi:uncharacterized membrane protein YqgA involved in biofilm formation
MSYPKFNRATIACKVIHSVREEEAKMKSARRMRCKIAALVLLCLFIGGVVGAAISISKAGNSSVAQTSDSEDQGGVQRDAITLAFSITRFSTTYSV